MTDRSAQIQKHQVSFYSISGGNDKQQEEFSLTATVALDGVSEEYQWGREERKPRAEDIGVSEQKMMEMTN